MRSAWLKRGGGEDGQQTRKIIRERERERQEERRGEGGRRKSGEIDERSERERERERKRARMGFNKSLLIKMADWSGINGRSAFSSPFNRFNSYMCAYISHVEWNIFPLFLLLAMMDNFSYRSRIKIIVTRRSDI